MSFRADCAACLLVIIYMELRRGREMSLHSLMPVWRFRLGAPTSQLQK